MYVINFISEPKGDTYKELINLAFEICDEFILVIRDDMNLSSKGNEVLNKLKPALKEIKYQNKWPGTELLGKPVKVHYYKTDKNIKTVLIDEVSGLYSWVQPKLPEDLCFFQDNREWLINTSHEEMGDILCENEFEHKQLEVIGGLHYNIRRIKNR